MSPWGASVPPPTEAEFFNAARPTVFLLVEGASDERFWIVRVDRRKCQVRAMGGREKALRELSTAQSENRSGFVAVLDADFDRLEGTLVVDPDIVWTDLHDLEAMLVASPALDKVLAEAGSRKKCEDFEAREERGLRGALLAGAVELGRLRWLSRREGLHLVFRKAQAGEPSFRYLEYQRFCDKASWQVDSARLVQTVLNFCSRHDLHADDLMTRMRALPAANAWQLCVGHDLIGLLAVGLRSKLGSQTLSIEALEERFRLAYEGRYLEETLLYRGLRDWEQRNPRFHIFP